MTAEEELIETCRAWDRAMVSNDADTIGKFMTGDWLCVGSAGITNKESFLSMIRSGDLSHNRMDSDEIIIRFHGETALVISRGTSAGFYKGKPFGLYEWSANMFISQDQKWVCVMTSLVPVDQP